MENILLEIVKELKNLNPKTQFFAVGIVGILVLASIATIVGEGKIDIQQN